MEDITIFTALAWERRTVSRCLAGVVPGELPRTWRGRLGDGASCLLVQTGIGPDQAREAAQTSLPTRLFLVCGCAGGLVDWLRAGDLVAADSVTPLDAHGRLGRGLPAVGQTLVAWAAGAGFRVHLGGIVSGPAVLHTQEAKEAAGVDGALAVDMESAAIAAEADLREIPFVGVRVVLDPLGQGLPPDLDVFDQRTGELQRRRAAGLVLRPKLWVVLRRLARQQRVAERRLGALLGALSRTGGVRALAAVPETVRAARR